MEHIKDGSTYHGQFHRGKRQGKGKFIWPDGSYYEGDFFFNKISGTG